MDKFKGFSVQKFDGSNFQLWKYQMEIIFRAEKLLNVVSGTLVRPTAASTEQTVWDDNNAKAMLIISTSVEFEQLQTIMACETAPLMWTRLKSIHEQRSAINKVTLKQQFFSYSMMDTDSIAKHISKIESLAQALADVGESVGEIDKIAKTLGSLPARYSSFVTAWDSYAEERQTFENLAIRLLKEEQKLNLTDEMTSAFAAVKLSSSKSTGSSEATKYKDGRGRMLDKRNVKCYFCHKKGHFKSECRKLLAKSNNSGSLGSRSSNTGSRYQSLSAELKNMTAVGCEDVWLADSAASRHMTSHRNWFSTFEDVPARSIGIQIGDNSCLYAVGIGSVAVMALVNGKQEPCMLENTMYVPDLKKNLFSVGAATSKNLKVVFDNTKIEIVNSTKVVAAGKKLSNHCYKMCFKVTQAEQANVASSSLALLWHERLGHVGFDTLKKMCEDGTIPNLKLTSADNFFCEPCQLGKMHRKPFTSNLQPRAAQPGEVIHSDLCGKMPQTSLGGANYFAVFKDECTSYRFVYFFKNKNDIISIVPELVSLIERQTGNKLKTLRSDNGREYVNETLKTFLTSKGISHETSSPYTPQQNGRAEREIRSIVESARTMLLKSNFPESFWAEAVNTAVYALNRRPSKPNNDKTPFEKWFNKSATIKHMKKFGSAAFMHIPKQFRSKFQPKARKVIMVGYDGYSQNYRLYDPATKKTFISRDVIFDENAVQSWVKPDETDMTLNWNEIESAASSQLEDVGVSPADAIPEEAVQANVEITVNEEEPHRRCLRDRAGIQKPLRYRDKNLIACTATIDEPQSFEEAVSSPESKFWIEAMEDEIASLVKKDTWELVELPPGRQAIGSKWVYRIKTKLDGSIDRFKARLCAKGYSQKAGIDYQETFAPVVRYESIRVLLALAAVKDLNIAQFDVKSAFLNGDIEEEIFISQPQGFTSDNLNLVYKLKKSLYGLKQSPRCWNQKFVSFLKTYNFKELDADQCVFRTVYKGEEVFLAIYVDDGLIFCKSTAIADEILIALQSHFDITIGDSNYFVGMEITHDWNTKEIFVSQQSYIQRLLKKFNMSDCKTQSTPCDPNMKLHNGQSPINRNEIDKMKTTPYREAVGSLMFLATVTRPDIMFAVSQVSRFLNNPGPEHWTAVKRIFRYLKGTAAKGIKYSGDEVELSVFSDADFAGDIDTRKSTTGYVSIIANGPITWTSRKQKCVSRSTTEAEYVAASDTTVEIVWLRKFLAELGIPMDTPTKLFVDNQGAIHLVKNIEQHKLTKHIDIKVHFIREKVQDGSISIFYISTEEQLADMFTKPLSKDKFNNNCQALSIVLANQ